MRTVREMLPLLAAALLAASPPAQRAAPRSIYRVHPVRDGAVIGGSLVVVGGAYLFANDLIHPSCPCDPASVNAIDRGVIGNHSALADYGSDATVGLALLAPIALALHDDGLSRELAEDLTVEAEAVAVSGALVTGVKYAVQRPLPIVYAGQAPELVHSAGGYRSFYSGHTTTAVAALSATAMSWELRHGPAVWPWLVVGAVGGAVGLERVAAGRHFYSDVAVGALAGAAIGVVVPWLHARGPAGTLALGRTQANAPVLLWTAPLDLGLRSVPAA